MQPSRMSDDNPHPAWHASPASPIALVRVSLFGVGASFSAARSLPRRPLHVRSARCASGGDADTGGGRHSIAANPPSEVSL